MKFPRPPFQPEDSHTADLTPDFTSTRSEFTRKMVEAEHDALGKLLNIASEDETKPGIAIRSEVKWDSDVVHVEQTVEFDEDVPRGEIRRFPFPPTGWGIGPFQP